MKTVILKYNAGNIQSMEFALNRLNIEPIVTDSIEEIRSADKVIFPGVGEASTTMHYLKQKGLDNVIRELKQPVLGVCLGMQLLCERSEENDTECLGIFPVNVLKFKNRAGQKENFKIPHMGWNFLTHQKGSLFENIADNEFTYFVHSYYVPLCQYTIAESDYIQPFSAAIQKDNFHAVQFHPEKSSETGEKILQNFLDI